MSDIVTRSEWRIARLDLLEREKELTRLRDEVARARRNLPRVEVSGEYLFDTSTGQKSLLELFDGRSQLIIYHFMMGSDWDEGCPSCSFWADTFSGNEVHLAARDVTFLCASRAPLSAIQAYQDRMGWSFEWVSSAPSEFNFDFGVSFLPDRGDAEYNYSQQSGWGDEAPGLSVFSTEDGRVFHTYSTYARGLDALNGAYQLLDLAPKGRDEDNLEWPRAWLRRHDSY
jgi:predicted dithiol-disulfide oxidoreductase (DUF899 family)